jgi:hypothetical protein
MVVVGVKISCIMYIPASNMDIQGVLEVMGVKNGVSYVETLSGADEPWRARYALLLSHVPVPYTNKKVYTLLGNPIIISYI